MKRLKTVSDRLLLILALASMLGVYLLFKSPKEGAVIYFLDVGQGDSILIKTVENQYILVDGGPDESALRELQEVIPFWQRKIDLVILTHPDQDHVGGLPQILNYYDVEKVAFHLIEHENQAYSDFQDIVVQRGIENLALRSDDDFPMGCCAYFDVLWPTEDLQLENYENDQNNISISFALTIDNSFSIFMAGDLGAEYEEKIFTNSTVGLDAIKLSHHGSSTSTSERFLEFTTPEHAFISVGEDNRYGHPSKEVLNRLEEQGIEVHRTDKEGRIEWFTF